MILIGLWKRRTTEATEVEGRHENLGRLMIYTFIFIMLKEHCVLNLQLCNDIDVIWIDY